MKWMALLWLAAVPASIWRDPSTHRVRFVEVEAGVKVEVLDWGGMGRPIVLLGGFQTAHAYDDFAPLLRRYGHVYGVTRRGIGVSGRLGSVAARRSAEDVLRVIEKLELERPLMVGHSYGGQDLTNLAAVQPKRLGALVYLDSAEDLTLKPSDLGMVEVESAKLPASKRLPPDPDRRSVAAYQEWQKKTEGAVLPEAEIRQMFRVRPDGSLGGYQVTPEVKMGVMKGVVKAEFDRIKVPVLAFFAGAVKLQDYIQRYPPTNPAEKSAIEQQWRYEEALRTRRIRDLKAGVPKARIVEVAGASPYLFASHAELVAREIGRFLARPAAAKK